MDIPIRIGTKYGVYAMLISLIMSVLSYIINPGLMMSWITVVPIIIVLVLMVRAAKDTRAHYDNKLSFGQGFMAALATFALPAFISIAFTYILFNFVDPSMVEMQKEMAIDATVKTSKAFGIGESEMEKIIEKLEQEDYSFGIKRVIETIFSYLLIGAFISSIIALIMKRQPKDVY